MKWLFVVPMAALLACQSKPLPLATKQGDYRNALDKIADTCGVPRSSWTLIDENHVTLSFPPGEPFEKADCLIRKFNSSKLPLKLGFIGNEAYENEQ